MKPPQNEKQWPWLTLLAVVGASANAGAQARLERTQSEPQWLDFNIQDVSTGVYSEGTFDSIHYQNTGESVSHESFFIGPSVGFAANGSIYHPNLLRYDINTDGAFGYNFDQVKAGSFVQSRNELEYLGRFGGEIDLLSGKPYRASGYASLDHTFRDNDFFDRVTVDTLRYGARAVWDFGNSSLVATYNHYDEESTSPFPVVLSTPGGNSPFLFDQKLITHDDAFGLTGRNERDHGGSSISYNFDRYSHNQGLSSGVGTDHTIAAGDTERFGGRDQFRLNSDLSYSHRETPEETDNDINGNVSLAAEHTAHLASYYNLGYEHFDTEGFDSDNYAGSATLSHQLFSSLHSSASVRASDTELSGDGQSGFVRRFGGGISEAYTKRLGEDHMLRIGNSLFLDQTEQQSISDVRNERHTIGEPGSGFPDSFYLAAPRVIESTIVITDARNVQVFLFGFDYQVIQDGARTRIQWLNPPGQVRPPSVLASYQTEPTPRGSYTTLTESFEFRVELWKNMLGLYARVNLSLNNANADLHVLDFRDYTFGADSTWHWLKVGGEYEIYDSTDAAFHAIRLYQSLLFEPDPGSTLNFDFTESWINYDNVQRPTEENYRFISRYRRAITQRLSVVLEGGAALRRGLGVDQVLATVRPSFRYVLNKTSLEAGYDYEYDMFQSREERQKNLFYARFHRSF